MDTTVIGIYKSSSNAQSAMNELLKAGLSQNDMQLSSSGKETSGGVAHSLKEETGVSEFFRNLYGREDTRSHAEMYEHAASQGNIVLTVHAPSEEMAHRAADVMERFGPVDVEEYGAKAGIGSQRMSTATGSKPSAPMTGASASSAQTGTMASPEGKDDLQKGRRQPVEAAEEKGPSASAEPAGMGQAGSGMGRATTGTSNLNTGATASAEGKDDLQKGRRQSVEAAEEEGPSAEGGVRMYQSSTGAPVQRQSAMGWQGGTSKGYDDSRFRSHWQSSYSASGGSYDEHQPAYRYGSELRNNERWRGKQWSEMESGVRSDWEAKNPKGMWEKFKDAVRYGWENSSGTYEDETRSLGDRMQPGMGSEPMPRDAKQRTTGERARPSTSASPGTGTSTAGRPEGASMKGGMSTSGASFTSDKERSGTMSTSGKDYDDSMFRRHWQKQYGSSGGSYDDYDPAYRYGYGLRSNERWSRKQWSDIEPDVRQDWEASHEKGTWEKFKDSIRYGWESMTGSSDETSSRPATTGKSRTTTESTTDMRGGGAHVPDDAEFRSHWHHNHWISGGSYDDYAPAYRYGADYADNDTNPNHQWKDVEASMRSDWRTYNQEPGSWEKNVDAIRYGWEKGKQRAQGTHSGESLRRR